MLISVYILRIGMSTLGWNYVYQLVQEFNTIIERDVECDGKFKKYSLILAK